MLDILIVSNESCGKTALCAALGKRLLAKGKKTGYFNPVRLSNNGSLTNNRDAIFVKEILELNESAELLSPSAYSSKELWSQLSGEPDVFTRNIKNSHSEIAKGKDVVLVEGLSGLNKDNVSTLACYKIAEALDARVIILLKYHTDLSPSTVVRSSEELGEKLLGVIINFAPEDKLETLKQSITESFDKAGIKVFGILPETRSLLGISVKELGEAVDGSLATRDTNTDEIVENIMLGVMTLDSGIDYFKRKKDKAAVIRGERADMQLAALQTPTKCLVLTNNIKPLASVVSEAESKHIPVLVTSKDADSIVADLENALAASSFNSPKKMKKFEELLDKYLDIKSLFAAMNI